MRAFLLLVLLLGLPAAAFADAEVLLKLELRTAQQPHPGDRTTTRSVSQTLRVKDGESVELLMKPEESKGNTRELWRFRAVLFGNDRARVESQLEVQVGNGRVQRSKFAATVLQGEPWEATVDDAASDASLNYRLTVWRIPDDSKFSSFDASGHPVWAKKP